MFKTSALQYGILCRKLSNSVVDCAIYHYVYLSFTLFSITRSTFDVISEDLAKVNHPSRCREEGNVRLSLFEFEFAKKCFQVSLSCRTSRV